MRSRRNTVRLRSIREAVVAGCLDLLKPHIDLKQPVSVLRDASIIVMCDIDVGIDRLRAHGIVEIEIASDGGDRGKQRLARGLRAARYEAKAGRIRDLDFVVALE